MKIFKIKNKWEKTIFVILEIKKGCDTEQTSFHGRKLGFPYCKLLWGPTWPPQQGPELSWECLFTSLSLQSAWGLARLAALTACSPGEALPPVCHTASLLPGPQSTAEASTPPQRPAVTLQPCAKPFSSTRLPSPQASRTRHHGWAPGHAGCVRVSAERCPILPARPWP